MPRNRICWLAALLFGAAVGPIAWGFSHKAIGSVVENTEMPTLQGGRQFLLSNASANVFLFFKPGQPHSRDVLRQIAQLEKDFNGKSVHWVAVVSSRFAQASVAQEVQDAKLLMPVLIDQGDALYGRLGVALEPVVGIADGEHKLVAYQPYQRVNYAEVIRARIRHLLKEISDQELALVLDPKAATLGDALATAHRRLRLAEKLFQSGNYPKALESVKSSLELNPNASVAHALMGEILFAQGSRSDALQAFSQALKLDPANPIAIQGKKGCETKETKP